MGENIHPKVLGRQQVGKLGIGKFVVTKRLCERRFCRIRICQLRNYSPTEKFDEQEFVVVENIGEWKSFVGENICIQKFLSSGSFGKLKNPMLKISTNNVYRRLKMFVE